MPNHRTLIVLAEDDYQALSDLAAREARAPDQQATHLLRTVLRGIRAANETASMPDPIRAAGRHPFEYQAPTDAQIEQIQHFREAMKALYDDMLARLPSSRERSVAITKLEEASAWTNKAIVFSEPPTTTTV